MGMQKPAACGYGHAKAGRVRARTSRPRARTGTHKPADSRTRKRGPESGPLLLVVQAQRPEVISSRWSRPATGGTAGETGASTGFSTGKKKPFTAGARAPRRFIFFGTTQPA